MPQERNNSIPSWWIKERFHSVLINKVFPLFLLSTKVFNCYREYCLFLSIKLNPSFLSKSSVKMKNTKEPMHCHCGTDNRAPRWTFTDPLQTRGETRCPGGVSVSCLASRTRHECQKKIQNGFLWRFPIPLSLLIYTLSVYAAFSSLFSRRRIVYICVILNVCLFDCTIAAGMGKVGPVIWLISKVTPTDHSTCKSVRSHCIIEHFNSFLLSHPHAHCFDWNIKLYVHVLSSLFCKFVQCIQ